MKTKLHYVFTLAVLLIGFSVFGQTKFWQKSTSNGSLNTIPISELNEKHYEVFQLDFEAFRQALVNAPLRESNQVSTTFINVPNEEGVLETFRMLEAPVFDAELSAQFPDIKSYVGVNDSGTRLRMSISPKGVETMISYLDKPTVFMQPVNGDAQKYIVYNRLARGENYTEGFNCATIDEFSKEANLDSSLLNRDANDQTLRKFRLAVSVTGEYTTYHGGTVPGALAAINASITRVNETFETDMAVTFLVIANTTSVIYTNASTDPYSDAPAGTGGAWNGELQSTLTSVIGEANYDIGHLFGASGGGGNAGCIGCVCVNNQKGSAYTSPSNNIPAGDTFDIDYVAHEIGHQMGANHTFAFNTEGTGVNAEPGSGSTIMAYAGITGANNVQSNSDPYFHYHSINQILNRLVTRTCWQNNSPGVITNNPPVANAGPDYRIPPGTAYVLKGSATDANGGDVLRYCWEQTDSGNVTNTNFGPTLTAGSMNRSLPPTTSPNRYIPQYSRVVAGQLTQTNPTINTAWETVSNVARTMNWALTVRDRQPTATGLNGQSSFDLMQIIVENVQPFTVPALPNWASGSTQTVYWNVGQTSNPSTINCQAVNIKFSTDGGLTFPTVLASNTPNDGSQVITVPSVANTTNARILVEAADNIFYALSPVFSISPNPDFVLANLSGAQTACSVNSLTYNLNFTTSNGFSNNTTFSATGLPAGVNAVFSPSSLNSSANFTMQLNNMMSAPAGSYNITVTATSASLTKNISIGLTVATGLCASVANTTYQTSTTGVIFNTISNLNTGKPSGYSNYTSISTDINRDSSYPLTVNINTDGNYLCRTTVWIDWNQNCSFNDAGESYDLGTATNVTNGATSNSPLSITVPSGALLGPTTMRVTTKYSTAPTSCENGADAEVEDYTVNVLASLSIDEDNLNSFSIFPNPNNGEFTVKLNSNSGDDIRINVYDIRGRKVFNNRYTNNGNFNQVIRLDDVQSGIYLINVTDGLRTETKKIIIK